MKRHSEKGSDALAPGSRAQRTSKVQTAARQPLGNSVHLHLTHTRAKTPKSQRVRGSTQALCSDRTVIVRWRRDVAVLRRQLHRRLGNDEPAAHTPTTHTPQSGPPRQPLGDRGRRICKSNYYLMLRRYGGSAVRWASSGGQLRLALTVRGKGTYGFARLHQDGLSSCPPNELVLFCSKEIAGKVA